MSAIAIIAGGGLLPRDVKEELQGKGREVHVIAFHGQTDQDLVQDVPHAWFGLGAVGKIIRYLKSNKVQDVVLAGHIKRPAWSELSLDVKAVMLIAKYGVRSKGDDGLLSAVVKVLEGEGIRVVPPDSILSNLKTSLGIMTRTKPDSYAIGDVEKGIKILKHMSELDVGQAVVIQQGLVLGIEAIEGTQQLISRSGELRRDKARPGGILIKAAKLQQSEQVDLPAIGPDTISQLRAAGLRGVAIEAGRSLILSKEETIKRADELGLFIMGVRV